MKFLSGHLGYAFRDIEFRRNVGGLVRYVLFLLAVILVFSILFHVIMVQVEGQDHSWLTGAYWTLTVMSTLGFGDITFTSDIGRAFSVVVLVTGIMLLLIVLPFAFIRHFYAPWLEARLKVRAPDAPPEGTTGHVVLTRWDPMVKGLASRLVDEGIPYFVIEEDGPTATALFADGVSVIRGQPDDVETYRRLKVDEASMVLANADDITNSNVALTVREVSASVPLVSLAENEHSVDILELTGCNQVLLLKRQLGEQLANRVNAGHARAHEVGRYRQLVIAEFSVHQTPLVGRTIATSGLREIAGLSVVGVWERGRMSAPRPDLVLREMCLPVVAGSQEAIDRLNEFLCIYDTNWNPVVVIGGGKVGRSAARALKARSIPVHMVEKSEGLESLIGDLPDRLVIGDAADREVMKRVGVEDAPSIVLSTNQDATNIYLAAYCRRLNPEAQIVSRITHDRNLAAIQRAGADLTLSYATLGVELLLALLRNRPPIILGHNVSFHDLSCPAALADKELRESRIGELFGLTIVGVESGGHLVTDPRADTRLSRGSTLLAIGSDEQIRAFREAYG